MLKVISLASLTTMSIQRITGLDRSSSCNTSGVDGVLGPVKPYFEQEPPKWVTRGGFFERPTHETGYRIGLSDARTGNVLFRRKILDGVVEAFRSEFGTGGGDIDFFRRMME